MILQIHPIPSYDDPAALNAVIDRMEQVGIYLMYDMRLYVLPQICHSITIIHSPTS